MRSRETRGRTILVVTLLAAAVCWAARVPGETTPAAKSAGGAAVKAVKKKSGPRTPADVSTELVKYLRTGKMPWQFYAQYAGLYRGFADQVREKITDKTPEATANRMREVIAVFEETAALVKAMADNQKVMDDIRHNNTSVPFEKRSEEFDRAREGHAQRTEALISKLRELAKLAPAYSKQE